MSSNTFVTKDNTERVLKKLEELRWGIQVCDQENQCTLPIITTLAVLALVNLGIRCTVTYFWYLRTKECSNRNAQ